jgi:hypothetical protein
MRNSLGWRCHDRAIISLANVFRTISAVACVVVVDGASSIGTAAITIPCTLHSDSVIVRTVAVFE